MKKILISVGALLVGAPLLTYGTLDPCDMAWIEMQRIRAQVAKDISQDTGLDMASEEVPLGVGYNEADLRTSRRFECIARTYELLLVSYRMSK